MISRFHKFLLSYRRPQSCYFSSLVAVRCRTFSSRFSRLRIKSHSVLFCKECTTPFPGIQSCFLSTSSASLSFDSGMLLERQQQKHPYYAALQRLVEAYRTWGHLSAHINPLKSKPPLPPELVVKHYINDEKEWDSDVIPLSNISLSIPQRTTAKLTEIITHLQASYTQYVGLEFTHLPLVEQKWLAEQMEVYFHSTIRSLTASDKLHIYEVLSNSETFDLFLQRRFRTLKRYSLEGSEAMLVALDRLLRDCPKHNVHDVVLTMAHRGRLNTLVILLQFPIIEMCYRLKGLSLVPLKSESVYGLDDVPSHIAHSVDLTFDSGRVHVSLLHNPSHLEAANPIALGKTRAKQDDHGAADMLADHTAEHRKNVLCVVVHGDAAFSGQGIVTETLQLAQLPQYGVGGTVHIIVNNQLGFTATERETRSTRYCSDLAKGFGIPVFHVSADRPEEVAVVTSIALMYRQRFGKDVIVDLVGYRRHGHNELDEPAFTQPQMYSIIREWPSVAKQYAETLRAAGVTVAPTNFEQQLDAQYVGSATYVPTERTVRHLASKWSGLIQYSTQNPQTQNVLWTPYTGVAFSDLIRIGIASTAIQNITPHERLVKYFLEARRAKFTKSHENWMYTDRDIDWATAEALAIGSLLCEGYNVRLSGQDSARGTFSQRHMKIWNQSAIDDPHDKQFAIVPLNHIQPKQGHLEVINSPLTELAVMGFEYGYSLENPNNLVIWEAQFGDFANGAQTVIDLFVCCGEEKWLRQSGLVLLLPHGYDGAGPDHSSGRLERFLQLANVSSRPPGVYGTVNRTVTPNMSVTYPSTPANFFHLLRRQLHRPFRKPLVVMSPKTLLRDPLVVSTLAEMGPNTHFIPVIADDNPRTDNVQHLVFCTGKIFYELWTERKKRNLETSVALIRIEELAPFPWAELRAVLDNYNMNNIQSMTWCQEEPENMGAWAYLDSRFRNLLGIQLRVVCQPPYGASAVGSPELHQLVSTTVIQECFNFK